MANLSKTRTVFATTSPRTIEKIIPEIGVLIENFEGDRWNKQSQEAFFNALCASGFYDTRQPPADKAFAGRDRITRTPKALGFVDLKPTIQLTKAGHALLSGRRTSEVFAKQMMKFQLPSPYHKIDPARSFGVRPYLELLRMVKELVSISKTEIAIFFVQVTNYQNFDQIRDAIIQFRKDVAATQKNKDVFKDEIFEAELKKIFHNEITAGDFDTRESDDDTLEGFLGTKKRNQMDYADAFTRYLRATQLVSFERKSFRLIINPDRTDEVDYILQHVPRGAYTFKNEKEFKEYLFDPDTMQLLTDDPGYLAARLQKINVTPPDQISIADLQDYVEEAEAKKTVEVIQEAEVALKDYQEYDDIIEVFEKIRTKDIVAPSLFLEWNVWRGLVMINDATSVHGNFTLDLDGMPLRTAPGNRPDIEAEYDGFRIIAEVTTSSGQTQYNMEGESVPRHFGDKQRGNDIPVYCIFVAPSVSHGTLAYFFNLNRMNTEYYGGKTRILPMTLVQYVQFLTVAKENNFSNSKVLKAFLDKMFEHNQKAGSEKEWAAFVDEKINTWTA